MEPAQVVIGIAVIAFIWIYSRSSAKASPTIQPGTFSQAGVVVDFVQRTIRVGGKAYPVSEVRGLRWTKEWNRSFAYITVSDLANPVHQVRFNGQWNKDAAQAFVARLEQAIEQAGGPHFK